MHWELCWAHGPRKLGPRGEQLDVLVSAHGLMISRLVFMFNLQIEHLALPLNAYYSLLITKKKKK